MMIYINFFYFLNLLYSLYFVMYYYYINLMENNNNSFSYNGDFNIYTKTWMNNICKYIYNKKITDISIPGSHNSCSYSCNYKYGICKFAPKYTSFCRCISIKWIKNQNTDIISQLNQGIRYFDLRVGINTKNEIRIHHSIFGELLYNILISINTFLEYNNNEIIVLNFKHLSNNTLHDMLTEHHNTIIKYIKYIFGNKIIEKNMFYNNIGNLLKKGKQIFIFYNNELYTNKYDILLNYSNLENEWLNINYNENFINKIEHHVIKYNKIINNNNKLFVLQSIVTPDSKTIAKGLLCYPHNLNDISTNIYNNEFDDMINKNKLNVILLDNVELLNKIIFKIILKNIN